MNVRVTVAEISSDQMQRAFEHAPIGVAVLDLSGRPVYVNATLQRILGYTAEELRRMTWMECVHPDDLNGEHALVQNIVSGRHDDYQIEKRYVRKDGSIVWGRMSFSLVRDAEGRPHSVLTVFQDISDWKRDQAHLQRQLDRLSALRVIDQAISGSLDLSLILNVLLEQTVTQLRVNAAAILLAEGSVLTYGARRGFQTEALKYTRLHFGEGYAGHSAMSRQRVLVADLRLQPGALVRSKELPREGFAGYAAVPLIAKAQVKGVLEVFCREPLVVQPDWLDFLDALASQAAIAIDNAGMLASLQVKNADLTMAYDATLEAWSRLMDLKDAETEGHSQRVTDVTLQLAREFRMAAVDMPDVRRGALLHDIGKIAIPDAILRKPGPLTEEEWAVMRLHPVYGHRFLSQIPFLQRAADIPYCHHERWDGAGYPRGLRGEEIPLAARVFAVADVWDALRSDRPYREAWDDARAAAYIDEMAGTHFDPNVVAAFRRLIA